MKTWNLLIMVIIVAPHILATGEVFQYSTDNNTWINVTGQDLTDREAFQVDLQSGKTYYVRAKNSTHDWAYTTVQMDMFGELSMATLSVTIFILLINLSLFVIPIYVQFSSNPVVNNLIKKIMWLGGLAFLAFNTTIITSMADTFSLGVTSELFMYQRLFLTGIYVGFIFLFFNMVTSTFRLIKLRKVNERMGEE